MGCCEAKNRGFDNSANVYEAPTIAPRQSIHHFSISKKDCIQEKTDKITKDYSLTSPAIGTGAFGEVRKAIHKQTGMFRAVKIVYKSNLSEEETERLLYEIEILKHLDHPNILRVFEFYQDDNRLYIVSELMSGGELFARIVKNGHFSEKKAAMIIKQVFSAIYYCHSNKIVHRDMKPENILYETPADDSLVKIIDFGTSQFFDPKKKMKAKLGTPYYIAPEVLKKDYDEKCDVWSCGVILYILLCGYPPFNGASEEEIFEKVLIGSYDFNHIEWESVSDDAKDLVSHLLETNLRKRYSAKEALNHPWFKKVIAKEVVETPLITSALGNLMNFYSEKKLQEAFWVFIVNNFSTKTEKEELMKTFRELDLNGDGQLSREELISGYKKYMSEADAEKEVDRILLSIDKNGNNMIDYTEFVMASMDKEKLLSKERLQQTFNMFDADGSGSVNINELKKVFGQGKVDDDVWKEIVGEVDKNGDGEISYAEFKEMMMKFMN